MTKRLLLAAPLAPADELEVLARRAELDPLCLAEDLAVLSAETIAAAAREQGARGIWTDHPEAAGLAMAAALRLGLPCMPAGERPETFVEAAEALRAAGTPVVAQVLATHTADDEASFKALGSPVWVRSLGGWGRGACQPVAYAADLPLALEHARKRFARAAVLLQASCCGSGYRVVGFKVKQDVYPVEILEEVRGAGVCPVVVWQSVPCGLNGNDYMRVLGLARRAIQAIPQGHGYFECEVALGADGPVLVNLCLPPAPHPALTRKLELATGLNLCEQAMRVAAGEIPDTRPTRDLAAAAAWLTARSGVVQAIRHAQEAMTLEGVHSLHIAAQVGQTIGHVLDEASRDQLGYVMAVSATREAVHHAARNACARIEIQTNAML